MLLKLCQNKEGKSARGENCNTFRFAENGGRNNIKKEIVYEGNLPNLKGKSVQKQGRKNDENSCRSLVGKVQTWTWIARI